MPVKATATGQSADKVWTTIVNVDSRYTSWRSNFGYPPFFPPFPGGSGAGTQFYLPFGFQTTGAPMPDWRFDFSVRAGYVDARQTTPGLSGSVSTLTDTALSGTATYTGIAGFVPFLSLNINAPTGTAALYGNSRFARMDPDLVDIPTYGEGWNIAPTLGANIPITPAILLTASIGYTQRNAFTKEGAIDPLTLEQGSVLFNPGDVTTYSIGVSYGEGPLAVQTSVAYATETTTFQDGVPVYRAGNRVTISGVFGYAWSAAWRTNLSGYWSYSDRNEVLSPISNALIAEAFNSNNRVYRINFDTTWTNGVFLIGPTASYLNRDQNSYSPVTFQFIPAKDRYSLGVVGGYAVNATTSLNARIERIWTTERANPSFGVPAVNSDAWLITAGGALRF